MSPIIAIFKTLLMRDTDPTELNKPWWQRRRYVQSALAVIGAVLYYKWGLVLDNDVKDVLSDNYQVIVNSVSALVAAIMTVWGVIGTIVGQKGATRKLKAALKECQQPPQPIPVPDDPMHFPAKKPDSQPVGGKDSYNPNLPESPKNP